MLFWTRLKLPESYYLQIPGSGVALGAAAAAGAMDAIGAAELALAGGVAMGVGVGAALAAGAEAAPPPQAVTADVNPSPSAPAMVSMRLRQRCPQPGSELFCTNFFIELPIWCGNDPPNLYQMHESR